MSTVIHLGKDAGAHALLCTRACAQKFQEQTWAHMLCALQAPMQAGEEAYGQQGCPEEGG